MRKGWIKFTKGTGEAGFELLAVVAFAILLVCGGIVWRLAHGPVDVGFAKSYIEGALRDPATGTDVSLGKVYLRWPVISKPLRLEISNVTLRRGGRLVASADHVTLGLWPGHLLVGRVEPVAIVLSHPALGLIRTADNQILLSTPAKRNGPVQRPQEPDPFADILATMTAPRGTAHSPLASLRKLTIRDATLEVRDERDNRTWSLPHIDIVFGKDRLGLALNATLTANNVVPLRLDAVYDRDRHDLKFSAQLAAFDLAMAADKDKSLAFLGAHPFVTSGNVSGVLDSALKLRSVNVDLTAKGGTVDVPDAYPGGLAYSDLGINAAYDGATGQARVNDLHITAAGVPVRAAGLGTFGPLHGEGSFSIEIPHVTQPQIAALWPTAMHGDGAEVWLLHKLSKGVADHLKVTSAFTLDKRMVSAFGPFRPNERQAPAQPKWFFEPANILGAFDLSGVTMDYRAPLMPVTDASGHGTFKDGNLAIDIDKGRIGDIDAGGSHVLLKNIVHAHFGEAIIDIDAKGPLSTVFRYIASEPVNMGPDHIGFPSDRATGKADLKVQVSFPTIRDLPADLVKVKVAGTMDDVTIPEIVGKLGLTGGPFHIDVADAGLNLKGKGKIEGRPIDLEWQQYLHAEGHPFASRLTASIVSDDDLRAKLGADISDWISGTVPVDVVYTSTAPHVGTVDLKADLTPGIFSVAPFGYTKPAGEPGRLSGSVALDAGRLQRVSDLSIKTSALTIDKADLQFGPADGHNALLHGVFPTARLNETNVALDYKRGRKGQIVVAAKGPFLDATYFLKGRKPEDQADAAAPPLLATVNVRTLRTAPKQTLSDAKLLFDRDASGVYNRLTLSATAGDGPVDFSLLPDKAGRLKLHLVADDAGAVLRAFNIYDSVVAGRLLVDAQSASAADRNRLTGHAEIRDFRVVHAPILAQLMNDLSLTTIFRTLQSGQGIYFTRLESNFDWTIRRQGDLYALRDGRTSGASLGLTFAGTIDKSRNMTDVGGTIIPVSGVNGLVGKIPVLGALTGGGALFAFTYTVKGPSNDPDISVNPLSALAPGVLRDVFFKTQ